MKKKTEVQTVPAGDDKPKRGPLKEKVQLTLRLNKELIDEAYIQMKEDNTRITDIIERGIYLALRERDHDVSHAARQVRFVLANTTREQQGLLLGLAVAMVEKEVLAAAKQPPLTLEQEKVWEVCAWYLSQRRKAAHLNECLQYYSRYGKSPEEIAQLGNL